MGCEERNSRASSRFSHGKLQGMICPGDKEAAGLVLEVDSGISFGSNFLENQVNVLKMVGSEVGASGRLLAEWKTLQ